VQTELAPCFLVAAPSLSCPFFSNTVVLLVDHGADGALGFVINKPADLELGALLAQVGIDSADAGPSAAQVMLGGPVSPETGWVLFDGERGEPTESGAEGDDGVLNLVSRVNVSANMDVLEQIAQGAGPAHFMMMLGYAGWGPGQLDEEIREGSWIAVDVDPRVLFETPMEERWGAAFAQLGVHPDQMIGATVAEA